MAFRLKLRATELDLPLGELLIGRGSDCFLSLDDDLVSRRHARLEVTATSVTLDDLGSRNGSRLNGELIRGAVVVHPDDEVQIGAQTFRLLATSRPARAPSVTVAPMRTCERCQILYDAELRGCPRCNRAGEFGEETAAVSGRSLSSFELLLGVGDKMLQLGRVDEAEKMIGQRLRDAVLRAERGDPPADGEVGPALTRGMRLASATGKPEWYGWIFDFARLARHRLDDGLIDELHAHMMAQKPPVAKAIEDYLTALGGDAALTQQRRRRIEALIRHCRDIAAS